MRTEIDSVRQQQTRLQGKLTSETQDRRRLQGAIEELDFRLKKLEGRFDGLVGALDRRLQEIEDAIVASERSETSSETSETVPEETADTTTTQSEATDTSSGTLGTINLDSNGAVIGASLAEKTFADRYSEAITLMQQKNYSEARTRLQALMAEDAQHALSSNVLYWLGESYYVEGDYKNAMSQFARSAQQYPDGAKRLDSLLKIGLSLGNINKMEQACKVLGDMFKNVADVPNDIAQNRDNARKRFGCSG